MVTDAPAEEQVALPYGARLVLTLLLLALYQLGQRVPLPLVDMEAVQELSRVSQTTVPVQKISILSLGLTPLIVGFALVELYSLVTSTGRRLRRRLAGRAKLNRAAIATSLIVSGVQAVGIAKFLATASSPWGSPLVTVGGLSFRLVTVATLAGATGAVYLLGTALTRYGVGNGFCLLLLTGLGRPVLEQGVARGFDGSSLEVWGLLLVGVFVALLIQQFRQTDGLWGPAFPQGLVPGQLAFLLWIPLKPLGIVSPNWDLRAVQPVVVAVLVALFSGFTFELFSSRPRLNASLPETKEVLSRMAAALRRRALPATLFLALGTSAFLAWGNFQPETLTALLSFQLLAVFAAIGFDLWDQFRFNQRHRETARLVQLDSVHFAYRLVARLREEGIECAARGLHFRTLFFFLAALFKIDVLVAPGQIGPARRVLTELEAAREIKAF